MMQSRMQMPSSHPVLGRREQWADLTILAFMEKQWLRRIAGPRLEICPTAIKWSPASSTG